MHPVPNLTVKGNLITLPPLPHTKISSDTTSWGENMVMCGKGDKVIKVPFTVRARQRKVFLLKKQLGSSFKSKNRIEALQIVSVAKG